MYFKQLDTPILLISRVFVEREKNTISFQALFLFHRVVGAGWSMLMLAYNAHCMLIQCSQKVFIKFASRRYDDTSPSDADVHLRFWPTLLLPTSNIFLFSPTDIWATDEKLFGSWTHCFWCFLLVVNKEGGGLNDCRGGFLVTEATFFFLSNASSQLVGVNVWQFARAPNCFF